ncbi:hypothetical protein G1H11_14535 [Phytoactinopolyspora alkaliphila]|uniref:Uncharacterized protein n=1 Tax=Phytoactinopolyspora alkaliphila TaxID=1783498 RepID=A0A6N9YNG8_9ACTN|nr:hypothetical protein [Phytoactinopolyspora alkaliphila]NED96524.1 hypothetical protein [Phytoactinopolyspora alkaliphila]
MSIHLSGRGATPRRIVISCDVAGCPVQVEPPPAERWRSDADALSWARNHAADWTYDPVRESDYCPEHAEFSKAPATVPPRPTAAMRDRAGNPVNRDDFAAQLRLRMEQADDAAPAVLTRGQATVIARLLDELAGVYKAEDLGALAHDLSQMLSNRTSEHA